MGNRNRGAGRLGHASKLLGDREGEKERATTTEGRRHCTRVRGHPHICSHKVT